MKKNTYKIFNNTVEITLNTSIIELFEEYQGELTESYIEHLLNIDGYTNKDKKEILEGPVSNSLIEELEVLSNIIPDFKEMLNNSHIILYK